MKKNRASNLVIFIVLLIIATICMIYAGVLFCSCFNSGEEFPFSYTEGSSLNYKVWLKENDFYSEKYLGEDYDIIASAIDYIDVDFTYNLSLSEYVRGVSYYTINSKIVAFQRGDASEKKVWDYNKLIKDKDIMVYNVDTKTIDRSDNFKIDYQMYRTLIDNYKKNYGVSLVGNLIIEITINSEFNYEKFNNSIDVNNRKISLTIPLTESVVKISKKTVESNTQTLVEKGDSNISYVELGLSLLAFCLGLFSCVGSVINLIKLIGIDSKYNKELKKILRNYGSVIVNIKKFELDENQKVMYVDSFSELLDAQQELRKPILYYNVCNNRKALFILNYDNDLLAYKMSSKLYTDEKSNKLKGDSNE